MSRGGRGRGGGGGGGRGGMFAQGSNIMGDFTFEELRRFSTRENVLFPDVALPDTAVPSAKESKWHGYAVDYVSQLKATPYYLAEPSHTSSHGIEQYSDRFLSAGAAAGSSKSAAGVSALQTPAQVERLNKDFFPTSLWEPFFERKVTKTQKKKRKVDLDGILKEGGLDDNDEEGGEGQGSDEEDQAEEDAEEEEDEEEDGDYDNNYFDGGDDEADVDTGGGDDEGGVM